MPILKLNPNRGHDLSTLLKEDAKKYQIIHEDPAAASLTSVDMSKVKLETILQVDGNSQKGLNKTIESNLQKLQSQGYVLLGASFLEELLQNPTLIPQEWLNIADTDMAQGSLRFDGTRIEYNQSGEQSVLELSFTRGRIEVGVGELFLSPENVKIFEAEGEKVYLHYYTAVYKP